MNPVGVVTMDQIETATWIESVRMFVADSPWLTEQHIPQLKALYAIAKILDSGAKATPALISQFTLTQRTLLGKAPEPGDPSMPPPLPGLEGATWGPGTKPDPADYDA